MSKKNPIDEVKKSNIQLVLTIIGACLVFLAIFIFLAYDSCNTDYHNDGFCDNCGKTGATKYGENVELCYDCWLEYLEDRFDL